MSLTLVKSTRVQVARFDIGLDQYPEGNFECLECKIVVSLENLRLSFRLVEGVKIPCYLIKTLCLRCRDSGI